MRSEFTFDETDALTRGRIGGFDTACPRWSQHRKPHHQRLPCIGLSPLVYEQAIHGDIFRCVYILGVDPGIRGGLAIVFVDANGAAPQLVDTIDIPVASVSAKERVDVLAIRDWIVRHAPQHALIERAQAMPKQSASSGFKYGRRGRCDRGGDRLLRNSADDYRAHSWKKFHALHGCDKESGRQRALRLFPAAHALSARKRDHGRSEADKGFRFPNSCTAGSAVRTVFRSISETIRVIRGVEHE
jgi:hypothetical protein